MAETIRLTIDGVLVEVEKGTTVIEAARQANAMPPHYCYHPGLTVAGNCRMCLVEIEKMPKLVTSCTTAAADGMVVHTKSDKVKKGVAGVEEFLLANHPLDCPICDQAGECRLQEYSFSYGSGAGRFREERLKFKKDVEVGPHVVLDCERCIMCTRCVRFCDEITKTGELGVFQRGLRNEIGIFPGRPLANAYSGNTVDLCPVGALTLKEFRFRKRVWFIKNVPSVCGACANGCNVNVGVDDNRIWRLTPRENRAVNGWWMCDEGRLSYQPLYDRPRISEPGAFAVSGITPLKIGEAVQAAAAALKKAGEKAAVLASANLTLEDFWALKRLASEALPGLRVVVPERVRGADDGFLIRADKTANRTGAKLLGFDTDEGGASTRALLADVAAAKITTLLVLGEDLSTLPGGEAALSTKTGKLELIAIDPFVTPTTTVAAWRMPAAAYGEFEGTWVNAMGRAQRVRRGVTPRAACLPYWQILALLASKLGVAASWGTAAEVLRDASAATPALQGITRASVGPLGVRVEVPGVPAGEETAPKGLPGIPKEKEAHV